MVLYILLIIIKLMDLLHIFKKRYKTVILITLVFLVIALVVTFSQPLKYQVQSKILVVQQFSENADPYSASRLNEYLSGLLAKIIYSESFFKQTTESSENIDKKYFGDTPRAQIKNWNKTIKAKALYDSGIITLSVYHPDKQQAGIIMNSAIYTLKTTNNFYHSIPNVDIRIIDSPSTSLFPVKPNILLNGVIGIIFGLIFSLLYIYQKRSKGIFSRFQ